MRHRKRIVEVEIVEVPEVQEPEPPTSTPIPAYVPLLSGPPSILSFIQEMLHPNCRFYLGLLKLRWAGGLEEIDRGSGYARVNLTGKMVVDQSTSSVLRIRNSEAIEFLTPYGNWGKVTHFGIFEGEYGLLLHSSELRSAFTVLNGDLAPAMAAGALTFQYSVS